MKRQVEKSQDVSQRLYNLYKKAGNREQHARKVAEQLSADFKTMQSTLDRERQAFKTQLANNSKKLHLELRHSGRSFRERTTRSSKCSETG